MSCLYNYLMNDDELECDDDGNCDDCPIYKMWIDDDNEDLNGNWII